MTSVLNIAVCIPAAKWGRMCLNAITPESHGIRLTAVSVDADLTKFDGLLHKFTYQLAQGRDDEIIRVREFARLHPAFVMIEPVDRLSVFTDRLVLSALMQAHPLPAFAEFCIGVEVTGGPLPFPFPVIVKAVVGCGIPESHIIQIVRDGEQLAAIGATTVRCLAFPYVPHRGVVFKCYALGDHSAMQPAPSLVLRGDGASEFDSQRPFPAGLANDAFDAERAAELGPSESELQAISCSIRESTGFGLLGIDIIRREGDGMLIVVDINYFPCFQRIPDVPNRLAAFIRGRAEAASS